MKRTIRLGGYGDPAMLPKDVLRDIVADYDKWLGYTHQWKQIWARWSRFFCMASVGSYAEYRKAKGLGFRTFRTAYNNKVYKGEIVCPATTHGVKCVDCLLCDGSRGEQDKRKNIVVLAHGAKSKKLLEV